MAKDKKKNPRRLAREYAVQALYQWQLSPASADEVLLSFLTEHKLEDTDQAYWRELVNGVVENHSALDEGMRDFLSRSPKSVDPVELAILRIAMYELTHRPDIPYRVIINESIDLAKLFAAIDSHRFVNGVLDKAAKKLRPVECEMKTKSNRRVD